MTKRWTRGFEVAKAAREFSNSKVPGKRIGASLYSGSNLIAIGFNKYFTTHPDSMPNLDKNIHAEHAALLKRRWYDHNENLIMYVWRETADGKVGCSRPCNNCISLMRVAGIKSVRFYDEELKPTEVKL